MLEKQMVVRCSISAVARHWNKRSHLTSVTTLMVMRQLSFLVTAQIPAWINANTATFLQIKVWLRSQPIRHWSISRKGSLQPLVISHQNWTLTEVLLIMLMLCKCWMCDILPAQIWRREPSYTDGGLDYIPVALLLTASVYSVICSHHILAVRTTPQLTRFQRAFSFRTRACRKTFLHSLCIIQPIV